jgi:hypothetical protein
VGTRAATQGAGLRELCAIAGANHHHHYHHDITPTAAPHTLPNDAAVVGVFFDEEKDGQQLLLGVSPSVAVPAATRREKKTGKQSACQTTTQKGGE